MGVKVADGIDVGELLVIALRKAGVSHKEAGLCCGVDASQWARSLRGNAPLDVWKLRHLPKKVWPLFMSALASALIQWWWLEEMREMTKHSRQSAAPAASAVTEISSGAR